MNRTIKDATVKRYHDDSHDQLERHLVDCVSAYNFGRRLKTLKALTPYEFICKRWTSEPERFTLDPIHHMPELNTWARFVGSKLSERGIIRRQRSDCPHPPCDPPCRAVNRADCQAGLTSSTSFAWLIRRSGSA